MNDKKLRQLERHAQAAADIIISAVVNSAAEDLADPEGDARVSLALLADAATFSRIAREARAFRRDPGDVITGVCTRRL